MSYSETVEVARQSIGQNSVLVKRWLAQGRLMDALKFTSAMLQELRNPHLPPKQYYEVYTLVFDSLSFLATYLVENHPAKHHLADLYELVQYAGNVIPRLYLMITVGTAYLKFGDSPREEILKDMIEMCRGVQNPIRGLFLRYYLSQRINDFINNTIILNSESVNPPPDKQFIVNFIMNNFIEMNKLWVRLQFQGPLRERDQRTKERKELQILVGSQLVKLSQIIDSNNDDDNIKNDQNFKIYQNDILPLLLEQIIQCKDVICQEYLYDIIIQVFPDQYHIGTLETLLNTLTYLNPNVSINKLFTSLIDRLNVNHSILKNENNNNNTTFEIFYNFIKKFNEERPDLDLYQFFNLIKNLLNLLINWYPPIHNNNTKENSPLFNKLYDFLITKFNDFDNNIDNANLNLLQLKDTIFNLLTFNDYLEQGDVNDNSDKKNCFLSSIIINQPSYTKFLLLQDIPLQKKIINHLLIIFVSNNETINNNKNIKSFCYIDSKSDLEKILKIFSSIVKINKNNNYDSINNYNNLILFQNLSKFIHILFQSTSTNKNLRKLETQLEILLIIKNLFRESKQLINLIFPSIITNFWKLIRKSNIIMNNSNDKLYYQNLIKQIFKYVSRCINDLFEISQENKNSIDLIFKLNLQSASLADQINLDEIAYDFFTQAFTVFEESLSDSKTQFQALVYMTQILQRTRSLYKDNYYDNLIIRCTLHGSKLLKKQDQCRSVYLCSHLWWATEIPSINEEEGSTENFYRHGKRLLECLQRSLRAADSIMDNVQSCELMVEILNRCLYYFIHGDEAETLVNIQYINGLIELIQTNLKSLKLEAIGNLSIDDNNSNNEHTHESQIVMDVDGTCIRIGNVEPTDAEGSKRQISINEMIQIPASHFQRTCHYIINQRDIDDRFNMINV